MRVVGRRAGVRSRILWWNNARRWPMLDRSPRCTRKKKRTRVNRDSRLQTVLECLGCRVGHASSARFMHHKCLHDITDHSTPVTHISHPSHRAIHTHSTCTHTTCTHRRRYTNAPADTQSSTYNHRTARYTIPTDRPYSIRLNQSSRRHPCLSLCHLRERPTAGYAESDSNSSFRCQYPALPSVHFVWTTD